MERWWPVIVGLVVVAVSIVFLMMLKKRTQVKTVDLAEWMRELGVMLKHRVPINVALIGCADIASEKLQILSHRLRKSVIEGETLSSLLANEFALPQSVLAVIAAGEIYGTLPEALVDASELLRMSGKRVVDSQQPRVKEKSDSDQQRIYEVAASMAGDSDLTPGPGQEEAPLVRIAHSILAQAIKSGAQYIQFEPVRTQKPPRSIDYQDEEEWRLMDMEIGPQLLVTFGREYDQWEAMRIPKYIIAPLYRRLKVMAEVPYWQKPPVSGRIAVRLGEQDYDMYLDSEHHPLGEKLKLEIREAE